MAEQYLKCPNCGANATNHQNCEYCGSLLVRFVEKGIDLSKTTYMSDAEVFPGLTEYLRRNLNTQKEHPGFDVVTDIYFKKMVLYNPEGDIERISVIRTSFANWPDNIPIDSHGKKDGLVITLGFIPPIDDEGYEEKFRTLSCAQLFEHREWLDTNFTPEMPRSDYAIDFGEDAEGAARLISEILNKVYSVSITQPLDVDSGWGDYINKMREQASIRYDLVTVGEGNDDVEEDDDDGEWPWWYYVVGGLILLAISKLFF